MENRKRLSAEKEGRIYFTVDRESSFRQGDKYRYLVDLSGHQVIIIKDDAGPMTVSRKKRAAGFVPLFDLRSDSVRKAASKADFMEIEVREDRIIVHLLKKALRSKVCSISELIGKEIGRIVLTAAGAEGEAVPGLYGDVFSSCSVAERMAAGAESAFGPATKEKRAEFQRVYDTISLFCGAGLLDYSFKDPHFRFLWATDWNKDACLTYEANMGLKPYCGDIRSVMADNIPGEDISLIIGGPCCQGFSNANRSSIRKASASAKRDLVDEYIRIVRAKHPKVFVIENVPQFLTMNGGEYLDRVLNSLPEYEVTSSVVEDDKLGGYTKRRRMLLVGSRIGKAVFPEVSVLPVRTAGMALSKVDATWPNQADVTTPSKHTKAVMHSVPQGGNWRDVPEELQRFGPSTQSNVYRRLRWDEPAVTLCNFRKSNMIHPIYDRTLTVSEASALMGLPKDFVFKGTSLHAKQQQAANGVTVAIGRFVKRTVLSLLDAFMAKEGLGRPAIA